MIRPFTLIAAILFVLSGAYLFAVKHRSQVLDDQIAAAAQGTRLDEARIRVLQAQWALEVDPSRLADLSTRFTGLQPMKPSQLVTLAALGSALPAAGAQAPAQNPEDVVQAMPVVAAVAPAPSPAASPAAPVVLAAAHSVAPAPVRMASAAPLQNVEVLLHNLPASHHARHKSTERELAQSHPADIVASALAPQSLPAPVPERPMGAQVMSVRAVAPSAPPPLAPYDGGSMLGMAQSMGPNGTSN